MIILLKKVLIAIVLWIILKRKKTQNQRPQNKTGLQRKKQNAFLMLIGAGKEACQIRVSNSVLTQRLLTRIGNIIMKSIYRLLLIVFFISMVPAKVIAAERDIELVLDNTEITLSASIRMDLVFYDAGNMPPPDIPAIDGLKISYLRSTDVISRIEGITQRGKRHTYLIMPDRLGSFKIGPFSFLYNNNLYKSKQVNISVISGLSKSTDPRDESVKEEEFRAKENIFLITAAGKERVYVNEFFPIAVALYYKDIQIVDIDYPVIEHEGFSMGEFAVPQASRKDIKGYDYRIITFRNNMFALRPGDLRLGPAKISCNVQSQESVKTPGLIDKGVQRKSSTQIESTVKNIIVLPLPQQGRPDSFRGAVGDFSLNLDIKPDGYIKAGEAITLTTEVSGRGNLKMVYAPVIKENESFIFYNPTTVSESDSNKIFKQTIVPKTSAVTEIPEIEFSFFDPEKEKYVVLKKDPAKINVFDTTKEKSSRIIEAPDKAATENIEQEPIGEGIIYIKEYTKNFRDKGAYMYKDKRFLSFQGVPVLLYLFLVVFYRRHKRFKEDLSYARGKIAQKMARTGLQKAQIIMNSGDVEKFYASIFEVIQEYFGNKFNLPPAGITSDIADIALKTKNFDADIIAVVKKFFSVCYLARFTPSRYEKKDMLDTFNQAKIIVEYFRKI
jgi:hypothetical protein